MIFVKQLRVLNCVAINRNGIHEAELLGIRLFTKLILNRCPKKRVDVLEYVTERERIASRNMFIFDILKKQREHVILVPQLEKSRKRISICAPYTLTQFLQKSPKLFELYEDRMGRMWCGLTPDAEILVKEEEEVLEQNSDKAAEYVTRMLMMSVDKRIPLRKFFLFRRDFGMPINFYEKWVHSYPELFKVVRPFTPRDEDDYLELVSWRNDWAITELEKTQRGIYPGYDLSDHVPGLLRLDFPMKFPFMYNKTLFRHRGKIDHFQRCEYLCPYAEPRGLAPGTPQFDKRAVAIMHELISFTAEKRLQARKISYFRREFVMPQKEMRLLLKYLGIFYVAQKGKRFSVYLNEAYEGQRLIEKHPLAIWKEKCHKLVGFGGEKGQIETDESLQDGEDKDFFRSKSEDVNGMVETEGDRNYKSKLEDEFSVTDDSDIEIDRRYMKWKN